MKERRNSRRVVAQDLLCSWGGHGAGLCMNGTRSILRAITWRGDTCGWKGRSHLEVLQEPSKKWTNDVGDVLMRTRRRSHLQNTAHELQSAVGAVVVTLPASNASSSRTVGRVAGPSYGGLSIRFYQFIWLRLTTTTHNHRRDLDSLSPLLYLLSYLCCQRRLFESHPCRWHLFLSLMDFVNPPLPMLDESIRRSSTEFRAATLFSEQTLVPPPMMTSTPVHIQNPKPQTKTRDHPTKTTIGVLSKALAVVHSTRGYAGIACSLGLDMGFGVENIGRVQNVKLFRFEGRGQVQP